MVEWWCTIAIVVMPILLGWIAYLSWLTLQSAKGIGGSDLAGGRGHAAQSRKASPRFTILARNYLGEQKLANGAYAGKTMRIVRELNPGYVARLRPREHSPVSADLAALMVYDDRCSVDAVPSSD